MYPSRVCPACKLDRIPDEKVVKQGKIKYVIYKCKACHMQDIERYADRPRVKYWNGTEFSEDGGPDRGDDSFFREG